MADVTGIQVTFEHVDVGAAVTAPDNEWTQVFDGDVWGLVFTGSSWWVTAGFSDRTITEYDAAWTQQFTFEANSRHDDVRGITFDGTNLWLGENNSGNDQVARYSTAGVELSGRFSLGTDVWGLAFDGTDLWVGVNAGLRRYTTVGSLQQSIAATRPYGMHYSSPYLFVISSVAGEMDVRNLAGTLLATVDVSGATTSPTGVWVSPDGILYVSQDGVGVWRNTGLLAAEGLA